MIKELNEKAAMELSEIAIGITIFVIVGSIGVYMYQTVLTSITLPANSRAANSSDALGKAMQIFYDNSVIIILAIVLAVVIGYLMMVRRK